MAAVNGEKKNPKHGTTGPLSLDPPSELDNRQTYEMIEELKRENNYEVESETKKRIATLRVLNTATKEFVMEVSRRHGYKQPQVSQFGGKVLAYGSYRLGVFGPGSDIDTLAIAPAHVKRDDFFESYPKVLDGVVKRELAKDAAVKPEDRQFTKGISSLVAVPESFMPIIKMVLNGIEIDLIFASIAGLQTIPQKLDLNNNALLMGLDQASVRAVTGPRVTDEILSLVPSEKTFRTALRAIKLWAQRRAIYANIVGYPGGVAWAMMVARVCQFYPFAVGAALVDRFFAMMSVWKWPNPVMLKDIEPPKPAEVAQGFKVWNPKIYPGDGRNKMPIITPAFPSMCATYNISESGHAVIKREIIRASAITNRIFAGQAKWSDLFEKHTFFTKDHKYYLSVIASCFNPESAKAWAGLVESKVRILVLELERMAKSGVKLARPFTKGFKRVHKYQNEDQVREIQKGSMAYKSEETTTVETTDPELVTANGNGAAVPVPADPASAMKSDARTMYTYTFYIGIDTEAKGSLNLVPAFSKFKSTCADWNKYDHEIHFLNLAPTKNWELPLDVFDLKAGEVRPSKPVKKVVKNPTAEAKSVRRSISEVEDAQAEDSAAKRPRMMTPNSIPTPTATPV